jgi:DNA-binding transcriptional LysR family regulator
MKFRMNDLENFIECAGCKTLSEAAKGLEITQPALSESIKRLESDLGEILFFRSRAGISLTPSGRVVLERARTTMSGLHEIESVGLDQNRFGSRVISIGCHPVVASYALPAALKSLERSAPDFKVNLRHDLSRTILTEIQQGRIDIGLVVNAQATPDLIVRKVAVDEVAVWSARGQPSERVFCDPSLIQTQSILRKWKKQPANRVESSSLELIARLTATGLGYGILPARAVRLSGAKLHRETGLPVYQDTIYVIYRPEFGKNKVERTVIDALASSLGE